MFVRERLGSEDVTCMLVLYVLHSVVNGNGGLMVVLYSMEWNGMEFVSELFRLRLFTVLMI